MSYYKHFQKKIISDWREYYISYKLFKQLLLPFKITSKIYGKFVEAKLLQPNQINSRESVKEIGEEIDHLKIFEYKFKSLMVVEAEKIESFFQLKFLETQVDWVKFQENAEYFWPFRLEKSFYQKGLEMKAAFQVFYKKVNYLIKYVNMNCDALTRLLRKHRKITKNYSNMMKVKIYLTTLSKS